jgi:hypothetical protein
MPFNARTLDRQGMARRRKDALDEHTGLSIAPLDDLLRHWGGPGKLLGNDGLLRAMTAALVERATTDPGNGSRRSPSDRTGKRPQPPSIGTTTYPTMTPS